VFHVTKWDSSFSGGLGLYAGNAEGYARNPVVDRAFGATHSDLTVCRLDSGGSVANHLHSFEQCAYVLSGHPTASIDDRIYQLEPGHFVLFPVGTRHAWQNRTGEHASWIELSSPLPNAHPAARDTFFVGGPIEQIGARPDLSNPETHGVGRYLGTPPQSEALAVTAPPRGRPPAGMDTAILAYSGISVKMMVDAVFGASLLTMFMVDYEPGGAAQVHDHPFEEIYFFLEGEIEGEIEGESRTFRAGDVLFCGVGVTHGFFNTSGGRVRWIETQAPQPPARHSYRWSAHWEHLESTLADGGAGGHGHGSG